ncbi:hypothetical protein AB205_0044060, partial [Aquarana catesbeiana]
MITTAQTNFARRASIDPLQGARGTLCDQRVHETRWITDRSKWSIPAPYHVISCQPMTADHREEKKKSCQRDISPDQGEQPPAHLCPPVPLASATYQCTKVLPTSAHLRHLPVPTVPPFSAYSATYQCHQSVPHQQCCPSVSPPSAHQCHLPVPISAHQCHVSVVPISNTYQCPSVLPISATHQGPSVPSY